jgi:4'-phosphopantetheinyl transferase EntD
MNSYIFEYQHNKIVGEFLDLSKIKRRSSQMEAIKLRLIQSIFKDINVSIENEENGKPILRGTNWNVSVSHSNNWLFIQTTPLFQPGIDIEPLREKVLKIAPRFVNTIDEKNLQHWPQLLGLHVIWGAKEAIYKSYSKKGLDFKKEILIELPADHLESNQIKGSIIKGEKRQEFDLEWELFPDNELLVFITNASNPI